MMEINYDFSGYVTKYNVLCSDGRTIAPEAFKDCDEKVIPLVSNLNALQIDSVVGSITLQHRLDGVYGYGRFNDSPLAKAYRKLVESHAISDFGVIRAVSITHNGNGANPEAYIDCVINQK